MTDAEFNQAVEQAYGNGTWAKFRDDYVMVVAGATRRVLDCTDQYGALERCAKKQKQNGHLPKFALSDNC